MKVSGYDTDITLFTGYVDSAKAQPERNTRKVIAYDELYRHANDNVSEWYNGLFSETNKDEYIGDWNSNTTYLNGNTVKYNGAYYQYLCDIDSRFSVTGTDDDGNEIVETYAASEYLVGKNPEQILGDADASQYIQKLEVYNPVNYGSITIKTFRDSLFSYVGITQEETTLINDGLLVTKTIDSNEIKFSDCIKAICQINAVFGHISEHGAFQYVSLSDNAEDYSGNYKSSETSYEEFSTKAIDSVRIYGNSGDIAVVYGAGTNCWNITNNFLMYSLADDELNGIAKKLYDTVKTITYTPVSLNSLISIFPITLGGKLSFTTHTGENVTSYVIKDTLSGAQLTSQTVIANGNETRNSGTSVSDTLGLLEARTNAIAEQIYKKITADSAEIKILTGNLANYKTVVAEKIQAVSGEFETLNVRQAEFESATANNFSAQAAEISQVYGEFSSFQTGEFETLKSRQAQFEETTTTKFTAQTAEIASLSGEFSSFKSGEFEELRSQHAAFETVTTNNFESQSASIAQITGELADYKTVMSQELLTAKGWMAEGSIGDAQISSLNANKISAGTIDTAIVTIAGTDGRLQISDNTIQIFDADRVRVQVGKDDSGDYTLAVWDASGNLIWDALGATENTIQRKIIRDKMVADDAAIQALKIDFQSFDTALTEQGVTISGTVVQVGSKMLNVALSEQEQVNTEYGEALSDHAARIAANENSIKLKVSTQEYQSYQTIVDGEIASAKSRLSTAESSITTLQGQISMKVEQTDIDAAVNGIKFGIRNLIRNSRTLDFADYYFEQNARSSIGAATIGTAQIA